jgi:hypothetical protein
MRSNSVVKLWAMILLISSEAPGQLTRLVPNAFVYLNQVGIDVPQQRGRWLQQEE